MRIAVVVADMLLREQLMNFLSQWYSEQKRQTFCDVVFICDTFSDRESFLAAAQRQRYNLVFLNISSNALNGIDIAANLHQLDSRCLIIFIANGKNHMSEAFAVHAFDYLIKPLDGQRLFNTLDDAAETMPEWQLFLLIPYGRSLVPVLYSSIQCITADAQYCLVYLSDMYRCRITFEKLTLPLMNDTRFLVINRGILVNMDYVVRMEKRICLMSNGLQFPVNTRNSTKLQQELTNYRLACRAKYSGADNKINAR